TPAHQPGHDPQRLNAHRLLALQHARHANDHGADQQAWPTVGSTHQSPLSPRPSASRVGITVDGQDSQSIITSVVAMLNNCLTDKSKPCHKARKEHTDFFCALCGLCGYMRFVCQPG